MTGMVIKIDPVRNAKKGGTYKTIYFRSFDDGKTYKLYIYDQVKISQRFEEFAKIDVILEGLSIYQNDLISSNSDFRYVGMKQTGVTLANRFIEQVNTVKSNVDKYDEDMVNFWSKKLSEIMKKYHLTQADLA